MASTYSDRLKLELMATGANANTWGTNTNNNLDVIDAFSAGYLSKSVAGSANITLTTANASDTAEASNKVIELTGALTGDIVVFIPAVESNYTFFNNTTGSQTLTIAATGHTANGTQITQGAHTTVYCDGSSNFNVEIASSTDAAALNKGTLPDARFPATLPAASGANLTTLNASELDSGTVPDARFPATLPQVSGENLTDLAAGNVASGTLSSDRLPTVPTTKGGTGLTSIGSAGQVIKVNSGASALEFGDAGGGGFAAQTFNNPGTYTKPANLNGVYVTCWGAGGNGAQGPNTRGDAGGGGGGGGYAQKYIPASSIPGPVSVTVGGGGSTSSFGSLVAATAGGNGGTSNNGQGPRGAGGSGSQGDINFTSEGGGNGADGKVHIFLSSGASQGANPSSNAPSTTNHGNGGGGGRKLPNPARNASNGSPGFLIVQEFFE